MKNFIAFIPLSIAALAALLGAWLYPSLPDQMVSHWNIEGEPDGVTGKFWGVALIPLVLFGLAALFAIIPKIDPLKANIEKSKGAYYATAIIVMLFLAAIYKISLLWNLGYHFPFASLMMILMGALFMFLGIVMPRMKRNWFVGIRTPWTLSSDTVWEKTHRAGGMVFVLSGMAFVIAGGNFPEALFPVGLAMLGATLLLVLYSYFEYRKERR